MSKIINSLGLLIILAIVATSCTKSSTTEATASTTLTADEKAAFEKSVNAVKQLVATMAKLV